MFYPGHLRPSLRDDRTGAPWRHAHRRDPLRSRKSARPACVRVVQTSLLPVVVLRSCAAENPDAFRRQIRLQTSPTARRRRIRLRHRSRPRKADSGRSGRSSCLARSMAPARPAPILSSFGSIALDGAGVACLSAPRFFFSASSEATTPCRIAFIVGPLSAVSVKKRADADAFACWLCPTGSCRTNCWDARRPYIHIVGP
mgnify:CR=1 FL=1